MTHFEEAGTFIVDNRRSATPAASIMIATYKRPELLKEAIHSALRQSDFDDYEIVVVDNDPTTPVESSVLALLNSDAQRQTAYFKNQSNIGASGNWNRCLELARADWVLVLHDDDWLEPGYLAELVKVARAEPDLGFVACLTRKVSPSGVSLQSKRGGAIAKLTWADFFFCNPLAASSVLQNRKLALQVGGFSPRFNPSMDYMLWLSLWLKSGGVLVNQYLHNYRLAENASLTEETLKGCIEIDKDIRRTLYPRVRLPVWYLDLLSRLMAFQGKVGANRFRAKFSLPPIYSYSPLATTLGYWLAKHIVRISFKTLRKSGIAP